MRKIEKYDANKTYISPIGEVQTPEYWLGKCPAIGLGVTFVVETDEEGIVALSVPQPLAHFKTLYNIEASLTEAEAIQALADLYNTPLEPGPIYTDETRIADALEDLVVLQMPDMEVS